MATQGRDHVSWAYVRAALISVKQTHGVHANGARPLPWERTAERVVSCA
jgi:hypothetical protein